MPRLAKAAKSAEMLSALCSTRGDKRTALEAEAYAAFMVGNLNLEREQWGAALTQLKRTRTICSELGRASLAEHAHLYLQTVEEVEPSIRFCAYNLRREGGEAEGEGDDTLDDLAEAEGASDILRSKLEAVLQESRARQALDFSEVEVLGERLPIKNEKARVGLLAMQGQLQEIAQLSKAGGDPSTLYDQLFVYFNDALDAVRADLRAASKDSSAKAGVVSEQLRKLEAHLLWQKLTYTTQQRLLLIAKQKGKDGGGSGRKGWAEDLVRLYETVQTSHEEMRALEGYKDSAPHMALLGAQSASVATFRCFYVGEAYAAAAQWREAQALYNRALERLTDALGLFEAVGGGAGGAWSSLQHARSMPSTVGQHSPTRCAQPGLAEHEGSVVALPPVAGSGTSVMGRHCRYFCAAAQPGAPRGGICCGLGTGLAGGAKGFAFSSIS